MPRPRLSLTAITLLSLLVLMAPLAACNGDDTDTDSDTGQAQPTSPPTRPPRVTVIVTPEPTSTPSPTPTLVYAADLEQVMGGWAMRLRLEINGSEYVDQLRYTTIIDLQVQPDGTVNGSGAFSQNIHHSTCDARVLDNAPLPFTVDGTTRLEAGTIWADIRIKPKDTYRDENYAVICQDFNDVRYLNAPVLWPTLIALDRLDWSFPLQSNQDLDFSANLVDQPSLPLNGQLDATVRLTRN